MKNFLYSLFLAIELGCMPQPSFNEPYAKTIISAVIHTTNSYDEENSAIEIVNITNNRLQGAVGIIPEKVVKDKTLPLTYEKLINLENDPKFLDIYIFQRVGIITPDGFEEVRGTILRRNNICDTILIISSDIGDFDTLSHEIGHMFGLEHTNDRNNIMNIDRTWQARFTAKQLKTIENKSQEYQEKCVKEE